MHVRVWIDEGGTQTSNDLSVETHTIRAPASQSLGNFLMTPSPAGDGITNLLCQPCTSVAYKEFFLQIISIITIPSTIYGLYYCTSADDQSDNYFGATVVR